MRMQQDSIKKKKLKSPWSIYLLFLRQTELFPNVSLHTFTENLSTFKHFYPFLLLIVAFHLPRGIEHIQNIEELTIVNLQAESTLYAETFANGI